MRYLNSYTETVIICMTNRCNLNCKGKKYGCIAGCQKISIDKNPVVDVEQAIRWMAKYTPGCDVHLTGGEPFFVDDTVNRIKRLVAAGHRVSVFSNGTLLRDHESDGIYDLPVAWQITHHYQQVSLSRFLKQIEPLKRKPHVVCRILAIDEEPSQSIANLYGDYNFAWVRNHSGFLNYRIVGDFDEQPNRSMLLIGTKGEIFSCSTPNRQYGSIYDMTFNSVEAGKYKCPSDYPNGCQACQSIDILRNLHERVA